MMKAAVKHLGKNPPADCPCRHALELAIWSNKSLVDCAAVERLKPLVGKYFDTP
jgi:hypothetical protein